MRSFILFCVLIAVSLAVKAEEVANPVDALSSSSVAMSPAEKAPEKKELLEKGTDELQRVINEGIEFLREQVKKDESAAESKKFEDYRASVQSKDFTDAVVLRALNKITARVSNVNIKRGLPAHFGNLEIILHSCWRAPVEENPESKALVEVWEQVPGEERKRIFLGWMFASSPALSAIDHAVYDLSVIECKASES